MHILLLSCDLLVASQVRGAAELAGVDVELAADLAQAVAASQARPIGLVLLDLATPSLDVSELVAALCNASATPPTICAFAPHVHEAKLQAARDAGCDEVVARGQLLALVQRYVQSEK